MQLASSKECLEEGTEYKKLFLRGELRVIGALAHGNHHFPSLRTVGASFCRKFTSLFVATWLTLQGFSLLICRIRLVRRVMPNIEDVAGALRRA
jgi:hypothetical protein